MRESSAPIAPKIAYRIIIAPMITTITQVEQERDLEDRPGLDLAQHDPGPARAGGRVACVCARRGMEPSAGGAGGTTVAWSAGSLTGSALSTRRQAPRQPRGAVPVVRTRAARARARARRARRSRPPTTPSRRRPARGGLHGEADPHAAITAKAATGGNRRHSTNTVSIPRTLAPAIVATPAPVDTMSYLPRTAAVDPDTPLEHDLRIILMIQSLRAFGYGFASVVLGAALRRGPLGRPGRARVRGDPRRQRPGLDRDRSRRRSHRAASRIRPAAVGDERGRRRVRALRLRRSAGARGAHRHPIDRRERIGPLTSLEQAMLGGARRGSGASSAGTTRPPTCPEPSGRSSAAARR